MNCKDKRKCSRFQVMGTCEGCAYLKKEKIDVRNKRDKESI
jgi:hypothetical protein